MLVQVELAQRSAIQRRLGLAMLSRTANGVAETSKRVRFNAWVGNMIQARRLRSNSQNPQFRLSSKESEELTLNFRPADKLKAVRHARELVNKKWRREVDHAKWANQIDLQ